MKQKSTLRRWRPLLVVAVALAAMAASPAGANAGPKLGPGAVFTETNTVPNSISVFARNADGTLTAAGSVATGGNGQPAANPPLGLPFLDAAGSVELSSDGDNAHCLFAVNAGSNTVSSFSVQSDGITLADQKPTNGSRPISVTSTQRGPNNRVLYVLNSDVGSASIQGYYVSASCGLTPIAGSNRPTTDPTSIPAQISFNQHGTVLAVSERFGGLSGVGDIDIFPVDAHGVAGAPTAYAPQNGGPYGLAWNGHDQLTVSNEAFPVAPASTVSSFQLTNDNTLVPINQQPAPGLACWNAVTNDSRWLYETSPVGQFVGSTTVQIFHIAPDGTLTAGPPGQDTPYNGIDLQLSHNSQFLYVLSDALVPPVGPAPLSAISEYSVNLQTGALTPIGVVQMAGNTTSGLAAW